MGQEETEEIAVRRLEPAGPFARRSDLYGPPLKILLLVASSVTVGVALWLFSVTALILPSRDPGHILMWRAIAWCLLAYSTLTWAHLVVGPRITALRWSVLAASVAAMAMGIYGIAAMVRVAMAGGHFEGYVVLMGLILAGHGLIALVYTMLMRRIV